MVSLDECEPPKRRLRSILLKLVGTFLIGLISTYFILSSKIEWECVSIFTKDPDINDICPIIDYVRPKSFLKDQSTLIKIINDDSFREESALKLSGSVKINTNVFDEDPLVEEDPELWESRFKPFHTYLQKTFPIINDNLVFQTVNSWGIIYTWKGSNTNLKPLLLTAHQDVVPIQEATVKDWKYPPFDGYYDGEYLWGRGSADCKNLLIGLLESVEELIKDGFKPKRTVLLAFGFDEEVSGPRGAKHIADVLLETYGKDSLYALIDEGGQSLIQEQGIYLALPGTGEKGYVDIKIELTTPGGHSSVPPDHTSIGIISEVVSLIESTPFDGIFTSSNPTFQEYQCIAVHSPTIEKSLRVNILKAAYNKVANKKVIDYLTSFRGLRYLIKTSQAIDIIRGGAKSNALPEHVEIIVNNRVAIESNTREVIWKDIRNVISIAKKYQIGVIYQDKELLPATPNGYFTITANDPLEAAPITPSNDEHWKILGGTIRHVYEEIAYPNKFETPIVIAPGIATGNTDTKYYWDLTKHIYRYRPGITPTVSTNAHSVNEHIPFEAHLQIIAFYYEYIQTVDDVED